MSYEQDRLLLESLREAVERLQGLSAEDMLKVRECLAEIAGAAGELSAELRRGRPSIPWLVLAEMGEVIRREGEDLDPDEVSATLGQEIPELQRRLVGL